MSVFGIDVSEHNGDIDWDRVKSAGDVKFAMIRAGYGMNAMDKRFKRNARECERVGIPYGVYWFSYAKTVKEAELEALKCLSVLEGHKIDYPVAFDWEDDSLARARKAGYDIRGKILPSQFAVTFLNVIRGKYQAMLYTNKAFLDQYFEKKLLENFDFWYANWKTPNFENPAGYEGVSADIWQYSSKGHVPGVYGDVDLNICYKEYEKKEEKKLTPQEIYDGLMAKLNFTKESSWGEAEVDKAKEAGFTDGSNPYNIPSRVEVMAMINRAMDEIMAKIEERLSQTPKFVDERIGEAVKRLSLSVDALQEVLMR